MDARFDRLYDMAKAELFGNILPYWMEHDVDEENGGFYGSLDKDGKPIAGAQKCLVLNARLVWTFASAYRLFGDERYKAMADRAYDYFCRFFIDPVYGGCYYMLNVDGTPADARKLVYGNAFAIYALSEYGRATGDQKAVDRAVVIMQALEAHAKDSVNGGYFEFYQRDWSALPEEERSPVCNVDGAVKSMNTHLHMIEAYTALYRVYSTESHRQALIDLLKVMTDKVYNARTRHFDMFFTADWVSVNRCVSYGHDIEGSWLLRETCDVLGVQDAKARACSLGMADSCLNEGMLADGSMVMEYDPETRFLNSGRSWWVEAEAVVGYLNAWQMSGEGRYLDASLNQLEYIDLFQVDHQGGEWFQTLGDSGRVLDPDNPRVSGWKCPYHNSRMCFEIIERHDAAGQ